MIERTVEFAVAAAGGPTNVITSDFNPAPFEGFLRVLAVSDPPSTGGSGAYTGLPSVTVTIGGQPAPTTPVPLSSIPGPRNTAIANTPPENMILDWSPVRLSANLQVLLQGTQAAATAAGRFKFQMATAAEISQMAGGRAAA